MESGWLRSKVTAPRLLREINEAIAPLNVTEASRIAEGRANDVYAVTSGEGESWVLRFHERSPSDIEHALRAALPEATRMPPTVAAGDNWTLMERCLGATMESLAARGDFDAILGAAEDIGRTLAVISQMRFTDAGFLTSNLNVDPAWPSSYDGLMGHTLHLLAKVPLDETIRAEIGQIIERSEPWLRECLGEPCLVHGDFKASNIMLDQGRVTGVLDWEFAFSGPALSSFAQILRFEHELPPGFADRVVRGYGQVLPERWREACLILDFVNLLAFLEDPECSTTVRHGVADLLKRTLRQLS